MTELSASDAAYSLRDKESWICYNMLITIYKESTSISAIPPITIFKLNNDELQLPGQTGRMVTQSLTLQVLGPFALL